MATQPSPVPPSPATGGPLAQATDDAQARAADGAVAVIPAYGCGARIGDLVRAVRAQGLPVVVVSDGSRDDTGEAALAAGAELLAQPRNLGKGAALAAGFAYALRRGARAVVTLDGDGQHDPADLPALLAAARAHPGALVLGERRFDPAVMPRRSLIGNRSSRFWLRLFAPAEVLRDAQCGYRVYPRWLLERHPPESRRFAVETELLLRAVRAGAEVIYVPVRTIYTPGGRSHFRVLPDTLRVFAVAMRSLLWRPPPAPR